MAIGCAVGACNGGRDVDRGGAFALASIPGGGAIRVDGVFGSCFVDISPYPTQCGLLSCALRSCTVGGCCRNVGSYLSG